MERGGHRSGDQSDGNRVRHQSSNQSRDEEEKLLNTESSMDMFLNVCDVFEKVLDDVEIDNCSLQVHEKLRSIQDAIERKIELFKLPQFESDYGDLSSSRSLASSMQSLCSLTSEAALSLNDDLTFKQFLIKVNCPFCSEPQADKIYLIRHLSSCTPFIFKKFKEQDFVPYSVFQILPNNSFKCNVCPHSVQKSVRSNFVHARTTHHVSAYKKLALKKTFTEFFFCSSCKVLIPNNYTQLDTHINSEVHSSKCLKTIKVDTYLQKNIQALYMKCKKFKCLICLLQSIFHTPAEIIRHFDDVRHLKALRQKHMSLGMIFCEFCSVQLNPYELKSHLISTNHKYEEKVTNLTETFELCLFCGIKCKDLMELAEHMKENCGEVNKLRKKYPELDKVNNIRKQNTVLEKLDDAMKKKSNNDKKIPEGDTKKRNIIIVKNNTEIPKLFGYFKAFGEILTVEMLKDENVLIEFKEKTAVDEVLRLRDVIKMNDTKLEITTEGVLTSKEKVQQVQKDARKRRVSFRNPDGDRTVSENEGEDEKEDKGDGDGTVNGIFNLEGQNDQLNELFRRVSDHLINSTEKFTSDTQKTFLLNDDRKWEGYKLIPVGFAGSGLTFSVESISLYIQSNSAFEYDLLFTLRSKLLDVFMWADVICYEFKPIQYVQATHRVNNTICKITNTKSAKTLTDILCYYMKENDVVKPFCLMTRFWLSVHELKIREFEYVIMSLLIFFLVNEEVVKPFPNIATKVSNEAFLLEKLMDGKQKLNKHETKNEEKKTYSVHELFLRFLHFLIKFDFNKHAFCVPVKHPIPRDWMRQELKKVTNEKNNSPMFIWDPMVKVNLARDVSENDLKSLLDTVKDTIFR